MGGGVLDLALVGGIVLESGDLNDSLLFQIDSTLLTKLVNAYAKSAGERLC